MKNELLQWWQRRHAIRLNRNSSLSLTALVFLLLTMAIPWRGTVSVPGVLLAGEFQAVYASERGQIEALLVEPGTRVEAQTPLLKLAQPELAHAISQTTRELSLVEERIQRQVGSARDLQDALVLTQQRVELQTRLQKLRERQERLTVRAPIRGIVSQMENLQAGQWVSENAPLMTLRSEQGLRVMALVPAADLHRIKEGAEAAWISNLPGSPRLSLELTRIDQTALQQLMWPELASDYGGTVPARKDAHQQLRPEGAWYQLELVSIKAQIAPTQQQAGQVLIQAQAQTWLRHYWQLATAIWIRESGF